MSTLHEAAAACCACIRVRWVTTPGPDGAVSGRWVCSTCEREFVPSSVARAELEQLRDKGAEAVDAFAERERELNAKLAEVTAERDEFKRVRDESVLFMSERGWKEVLDWAQCDVETAKQRGVSTGGYESRVARIREHLERAAARDRELDKARADFARDQAELASLRNQLAARTDERDQCHLRAQTAELEVERLATLINVVEFRLLPDVRKLLAHDCIFPTGCVRCRMLRQITERFDALVQKWKEEHHG